MGKPRRIECHPSSQPLLTAKQKGFTLAESLIVATILGILAAVAIPLYTSYANSQRQQSVSSLAQTAAVSANAMYRRGITPTDLLVKNTMFLPNPSAYNVTVNTSAGTITVQDAANTTYSATLNYR